MTAPLAILASARQTESSDALLPIVLSALGIMLAAAIVAFVPIAIARKRRHRNSEIVVALAILWGLVSAGSGILTVSAQINWSRERDLRIKTGFYDPQDLTDAPSLPWLLWSALIAAYVAMLLWSATGKDRMKDEP